MTWCISCNVAHNLATTGIILSFVARRKLSPQIIDNMNKTTDGNDSYTRFYCYEPSHSSINF